MSEEDPITDSADWFEGDVTIISSDRVRFRVRSYLLTWSCTVFADVFNLPGEQEQVIHLSASFEDANTIDAFLTLVSEIKLPFEVSSEASGVKHRYRTFVPILKNLLAFMEKYGSSRGLRLLRTCVSDHDAHEKWSVEDAFILGALLNDRALCKKSFSYNHDTWDAWGEEFRSSTMPYDYYAAIPLPYSFALTAASYRDTVLTLDEDKFDQALDQALESEEASVYQSRPDNAA